MLEDISKSEIDCRYCYKYMIVMFIFDLYSAGHINNELHQMKKIIASAILTILVGTAVQNSIAKDFLNVSYDPTREFYQEPEFDEIHLTF